MFGWDKESGMRLKTHDNTLCGEKVVLRPMTEDDWDVLARWNEDPEVLWYSEGDDVTAYSLQDIQGMYREVSQSAFCFIIESDGSAIGECWLQEMNLDRILLKCPSRDCRRIDIMIGETALWGRGHGTDAIRALVRFAFEQEHADMVFACGIADYNGRSLRAFQKAGFQIDAKLAQPHGSKSEWNFDVALARDDHLEGHGDPNNGTQAYARPSRR